jgi:D-alanine-D-alanine ligase
VSQQVSRVLIVYNEPVLPPDHPEAGSENDVVETVAEVELALGGDEFIVERFGYARRPRGLLQKLAEWKPDVVFNLFEGEADRPITEVYHTGLLEWLNIPFTGSPAATLAFCRDKVRTKYLLQGAQLDTAPFQMVESVDGLQWTHEWPAIVKPAFEDASVGIEQGSVVTSPAELKARVALVLERFGPPAIVEQFVAGREFHVNMFEDAEGNLHMVPPTEIRFEAGPGYWPIYSYQGKWDEHSIEFKTTPLDTAITLPGPMAERVVNLCKSAYRLMGMRDYGRVDVRVTEDGRPFALEANPNPYLNSIALVDGLKSLDISFEQFVRGLARRALARTQRS